MKLRTRPGFSALTVVALWLHLAGGMSAGAASPRFYMDGAGNEF
jgi:hypothetical protein